MYQRTLLLDIYVLLRFPLEYMTGDFKVHGFSKKFITIYFHVCAYQTDFLLGDMVIFEWLKTSVDISTTNFGWVIL